METACWGLCELFRPTVGRHSRFAFKLQAGTASTLSSWLGSEGLGSSINRMRVVTGSSIPSPVFLAVRRQSPKDCCLPPWGGTVHLPLFLGEAMCLFCSWVPEELWKSSLNSLERPGLTWWEFSAVILTTNHEENEILRTALQQAIQRFSETKLQDQEGMLSEWLQTKHKAPRQWKKEMKLNRGGAQ